MKNKRKMLCFLGLSSFLILSLLIGGCAINDKFKEEEIALLDEQRQKVDSLQKVNDGLLKELTEYRDSIVVITVLKGNIAEYKGDVAKYGKKIADLEAENEKVVDSLIFLKKRLQNSAFVEDNLKENLEKSLRKNSRLKSELEEIRKEYERKIADLENEKLAIEEEKEAVENRFIRFIIVLFALFLGIIWIVVTRSNTRSIRKYGKH